MKNPTSKPSLRLVVSSAEARQKYTTSAKAWARLNVTTIGTSCRYALRTIEQVGWVLLFMLALILLASTTALKGIWSGWSKKLFSEYRKRAD